MGGVAVAISLVACALARGGEIPSVATNAGPSALTKRIVEQRRAGNFASAAELATRLLELRTADPAAADWQRADSRRLAETLRTVLELPAADRAALAAADRSDPVRRAAIARGDYKEAGDIAARQLETRRRLLGSEHPEVGVTLAALAATRNADREGRVPEALYRESVAILRSVWDDHPDLADAIDGLARHLLQSGHTEEIDALAVEAHEMRRRIFGDEHPDVADSLHTRALIERRRNDHEAMKRFALKALAMRRRLFGDEHLDVAESLHAMGMFYGGVDWAAAERYARDALAMRRRLAGDEHPLVEESLVALAETVRWVGEPAEARDILRDVAALQERLRGEDDPALGATLNNLALAHRFLKEYDQARPLLERAVGIYSAAVGEDHQWTLVARANLALNHAYRGDYPGAHAILDDCRRRARTLAETLNVDRTLGTLDSYQARVADLEGDPAAAEVYRRRSVSYGMTRGEDTAAAVSVNIQLGKYRAAQGDLEGAQAYFERAARGFEGARGRAGAGTRAATFQKTPYERLALTLLERGCFDEAWPAVERARGRVLADLLLAAEEKGDSFTEPFSLKRVQASLAADQAIVGWLDFRLARAMPRHWGYVIRRTGPVRWARIPGQEDIEELAERLRKFRDDLAATSSLGRRPPLRRDEARALWEERFAPLEPYLDGVGELILIPSWAMGGFPVEILVDSRDRFLLDRFDVSYTPSATVHAWLQENRTAREPRSVLLVGDPPFAEGHVSKEGTGGAELLTEAASLPADSSVLRSALRGDTRAAALLPRLHWSRQEVAWAARSFREPTLLVGAQASEQRVAQMIDQGGLRSYDVVHIATHALIDNEKPERSGLVLSQLGLSEPDASWTNGVDGIVTGAEILDGWELDAELVTLSACQTALGRNIYGEGVVGLSYPFLKAGAHSLLVSLWSVQDQATALLMRRFYGVWLDRGSGDGSPRRGKAEALRDAKRWLRDYRDAEGRQPYRHPYYWSGFVLIGDGG